MMNKLMDYLLVSVAVTFLLAASISQSQGDPAQGSLEAYAAGAFARFVRPRLVREARWLAALEPEVEGRAELGIDTDPGGGIDVARVGQTLSTLDEADREVLLARFGPVPISERAVSATITYPACAIEL